MTNMPFFDRLDDVVLPAGSKLPQFNLFDGNGNSLKHLKGFIAHMTITSTNSDVLQFGRRYSVTGAKHRKRAHSPPPSSRGLVRFSQHGPQGDHNRHTPISVSVA
ncbi:hypothetical protein LIER_16930 [Lithospermum erythrorhizon]|uniref:Uncharacterized protein n=1 Tax=Lithospermum erythrorhizon TaxID=34254 RepID=A0AAV3Q8H3_LITER